MVLAWILASAASMAMLAMAGYQPFEEGKWPARNFSMAAVVAGRVGRKIAAIANRRVRFCQRAAVFADDQSLQSAICPACLFLEQIYVLTLALT